MCVRLPCDSPLGSDVIAYLTPHTLKLGVCSRFPLIRLLDFMVGHVPTSPRCRKAGAVPMEKQRDLFSEFL